MGRGIKLSDSEFDQLDHLRFSTSSADVFRNCLIILMSDASDTIASIAERVGCTTFTVKRVRRLYREGGIDALRPIKPPGRPGRATAEFLAAMKKAVGTNPLKLASRYPRIQAVTKMAPARSGRAGGGLSLYVIGRDGVSE
jgi:transposase-like protein